METTRIRIEGMTCGGCVGSVRRVLAALPGVESVDVSLAEGSATVRHDPARADTGALAAAVESAGYSVPR